MKKQLQTIAKKAGLFSALIGVSTMCAQTTAFNYTGGMQTYVVPLGVTSITVDVQAAQGGDGPSAVAGGLGGRTQAILPVTPGSTLNIFVGGAGAPDVNASAAGGYNGGGNAMLENSYTFYGGGGGGGASDIRLGGILLTDRIVVAGGGGGGGADGCNTFGLLGGQGGGLIGGAGAPGTMCSCNPSGQGGTQVAGGVKGDWGCSCNATAGSLGLGGNSNSTSCGGPTGGGGGGGGYYGGGGGGLGAGGGGSNYTIISATGVVNTPGFKSGNGIVIITAYGVTISQTTTISCNGQSTAALSTTVSGGIAPYTYTWLPTGGSAPTATALAAGVYTCVVQDAGLNLTANTFTVTQPTLLVSGVTSQTNITCNGGNDGAITLTVTGGTTPYSYTWSPTGGSAAMASGLGANTYTCLVKDANNCSNQPTVTLTQPAGIMAVSNSSLICAGETASIMASGATSYTWNTAATTSVIVVSPTVTTVYTVNATNGVCNYSATVTQNVSACTGINELTTTLISVYPNPNNGIVNISLTAALAQNATLEIYDALGKLLVKQVLGSELNTINISNLNNGLYTFKVLNNNNTIKVGKLIKQ